VRRLAAALECAKQTSRVRDEARSEAEKPPLGLDTRPAVCALCAKFFDSNLGPPSLF